MNEKISDNKIRRIKEMYSNGLTYQSIATLLGVSIGTVSKYVCESRVDSVNALEMKGKKIPHNKIVAMQDLYDSGSSKAFIADVLDIPIEKVIEYFSDDSRFDRLVEAAKQAPFPNVHNDIHGVPDCSNIKPVDHKTPPERINPCLQPGIPHPQKHDVVLSPYKKRITLKCVNHIDSEAEYIHHGESLCLGCLVKYLRIPYGNDF